MRRNRRFHKKQKPVPKKQFSIFFSKVFFAGVLSFLFSSSSFAQLTYTTLTVQYDSPWVCNNLKLIPVKFKDTAVAKKSAQNNNTISFEDALKEGKITVREMTTQGGADVGMLELRNHSKKKCASLKAARWLQVANRTGLLQKQQ
jgi:hypothetical protein